MGLYSRQYDHTWNCRAADIGDDRTEAAQQFRQCAGSASDLISLKGALLRIIGGLKLYLGILCASLPQSGHAGSLNVAVYHTSLARPGPGILLRDILAGKDPQVLAVSQIIRHADPDILLLLDVDYDHDLLALQALRDKIGEIGSHYPYLFAARPNSGMQTGLDLDRDGKFGGPRDAQGFGQFSGQGGLALLSKYPIGTDAFQDYSPVLWQDLPEALLTLPDGQNLLEPEVLASQRLSSTAHWALPVNVDGLDIWLMAFHAGPPVFSGFADHNARRNHDEAQFWIHYLAGRFAPPPADRFILLGGSNMDPDGSNGRPAAMRALLAHPRLQDPKPKGFGWQNPTDGHRGDPALATARWPPPGPGNLRVDYILPFADWTILGSEVVWPEEGTALATTADTASRHALVMVTLATP